MDDLVAEIKKIYIEELTTYLAPHNFLIAILYMLSSLLWNYNDGIWNVLLSYKVFNLLDFSEGPITEITTRNIFLSIFCTFLTGWIYQRVKIGWFNLVSRKLNIEKTINKHIEDSRQLASQSEAVNLFILKDIRKDIDRRERNITKKHIIGEIMTAGFLISFLSFWFGFILSTHNQMIKACYFDLFIGFAFLIYILYIQESSMTYYLSKVMPLIVIEKAFLNENYKPG